MAKPQFKFKRLKATYLMLAVAAILAVGSYGWHIYTLFRDWQLNMPQPQTDKLARDLRIFHKKTGRFPNGFTEINGLIWRAKPTPNYGKEGRQARTKNYYYFYTKVNDHTCAFWALPTGPQRHYAASFFLVISPDWLRGWKGNALEDETINNLPAIPVPDKLAELKMHELPGQKFSVN